MKSVNGKISRYGWSHQLNTDSSGHVCGNVRSLFKITDEITVSNVLAENILNY